jgi:acetoin utilization protein AcuC
VTGTVIAWDDALLGYDLGDHPLDPVRLELTMALARGLGLLDRAGVRVVAPEPAGDDLLGLVHRADYLAAVKAAPDHLATLTPGLERRLGLLGWGLGTPDNPVFERMHEASAHVAGATVTAAAAVWRGEATRAVSIAGGLHHAMPARASGFCVYNDPAVAIAWLLTQGVERVAYVDIDVHHGDGVQEVFWDDPRVLTISLHESPVTLFPGTGFPSETGGDNAPGSAVNVALPAGTGDAGWLRAFHAVVPPLLRAFRPELLVTQCGVDTHRLDPLANLRASVDGQRAAYLALRSLADELCDGRWVATGGGGYALVEVVPRAWSHLLAIATGEPLDPATPTPESWRALAAERRPDARVPQRLTDDADPWFLPWRANGRDRVDAAITTTRREVFPLHGLDPEQPTPDGPVRA